ncbi:MAG: (RAP Annotation release2) Galactose-binding like domain containing [Trebouxia sp. A1-2]|nr:MAG: (RAP Annotation release2) Galactose-binding like domain containing [Trebouxia sp. A1-2]
MHSACTFRHSRVCSTWAISQPSPQYQTVKPREARRIPPLTACTRSYVDQVESHLHSSDLQDSPSDPSAGSPVQLIRSKLDESLPYVAVLKAKKEHKQPVQEKQKPLADYMRLPASQYSVLDAKKIERLDDDTFICYVGGLNFLGFVVEPVLTVSVIVQDRGPVVKLLDTKLQGSKTIMAANDRFGATMTNTVTWEGDEGSEVKQLCSETSIQVALEVPRWARVMPTSAIESTGSRVMQTVLNSAVPKFLKQLQKDYDLWAAGDDSRKPMGNGEL